MATTNSTIELILRHFCAGPIASTSFRRIGFTLGEAGAAAQEKTASSAWVGPGRRERFARISPKCDFVRRSHAAIGHADELGIRSTSPRMVEGEAVPASLMGGVCDPEGHDQEGRHHRHRPQSASPIYQSFHLSTLIGRRRSISRAWRRDSASMSLACAWSE